MPSTSARVISYAANQTLQTALNYEPKITVRVTWRRLGNLKRPIEAHPCSASVRSRRIATWVKLQATMGAERFVSPIAVAGLVVCVIGLKLGPGRKALGVVSEETSLLIGFGIGGGILLSAALLWILIDNYYVLDRSSRRVFLHKGFRFFGSEAPFLGGRRHHRRWFGLRCD